MATADHVILELVQGHRVVKEVSLDASGLDVDFQARIDHATGLPTAVVRSRVLPAQRPEVTPAQETAEGEDRSNVVSPDVVSPDVNGTPQASSFVPADHLTDIAKLVRESDLSAYQLELLQSASCVQLEALRKLVTERQAERKKLEDWELKNVNAIFDEEVKYLAIKDKKQARRFWRKATPKSKQDIRNAKVGKATLPQPYEEIRTLLEIEKTPIYAKALEEWTRKEALFTSSVERKKKKAANLKNEIYQLIGFFSVFQGVLLTAVSQSNLLHCNNLWSPICLSVVASVVSVAGVIQKLRQISSLQKTIHSEKQSLAEVVKRSNRLRGEGVPDPAFKKGFEFAQFHRVCERRQSKRRQWTYFTLVIGSLILFAVGFPASHWRILCDPGAEPYPTSGSSSN